MQQSTNNITVIIFIALSHLSHKIKKGIAITSQITTIQKPTLHRQVTITILEQM
jgi:hypothetical protein